MRVRLINHTQNALPLLLFTKNTRLAGAQTLQDIQRWPYEKQLEHLAYMRDTIQSSWEFVNYTFQISDVTRAFTHQFVRTRTGKYAQESQRTIDASEHQVLNLHPVLEQAGEYAMAAYEGAVNGGVPPQEARAILPTNIETSIIAQFDLRTLHNMGLLRLCTRTQGEYQRVFKEMRQCVIDVHPWAADFIKVKCAWDGVCAFPRYTECPVQPFTLQAYDDRLKIIESEWEQTEHEAVPIAKDGTTM